MKLRKAVIETYLRTCEGRSTDDVILDDKLNMPFVENVQTLHPGAQPKDINKTLINARKSKLGKTTKETYRLNHDEYEHAAKVAARLTEHLLKESLDNIFCDPELRIEFDTIAHELSPNTPPFNLRKCALGLRKKKQLKPIRLPRILDAEWNTQTTNYPAPQLLKNHCEELLINAPTVYLFYDPTGFLYIGQTTEPRDRIHQHITHSDIKLLAQYIWEHGLTDIKIEIRTFDKTSTATNKTNRRDYEVTLIENLDPTCNTQGKITPPKKTK